MYYVRYDKLKLKNHPLDVAKKNVWKRIPRLMQQRETNEDRVQN